MFLHGLHVTAVPCPLQGFRPGSGTVQELNFRGSKATVLAVGRLGRSQGGEGRWIACRETTREMFISYLPEYSTLVTFPQKNWNKSLFIMGTVRLLRSDHWVRWRTAPSHFPPSLLPTKHMVLALKELLIRGDFCTTVEYVITLLETESLIPPQPDQHRLAWPAHSWEGGRGHVSVCYTVSCCTVLHCVIPCYTVLCCYTLTMQVKWDNPDPILEVICGYLCIVQEAFQKRFADYQAILERWV